MVYLNALLLLSLTTLTSSVLAAARQPYQRYRNSSIESTISSKAKSSKSKAKVETYTFVANTHRNLAVYYGKTSESLGAGQNLTSQCADPNIDIVILGFLLDILGPGDLPTMGINNTSGEMCELPNASMLAAGGTGLRRCASLQSQILTCQGLGKKVFISVGGAKGTQTFTSQAQAEQAATVLWDLFGSGTGQNLSLRPFGESVTVDGFDIDNETGDGTYYVEFAAKLRTLTKSQSAKQYYLSAAPACYYPNAGAPVEMLTQMDFVWPQFYAAPSCNLGTANFPTSFSAWSERLDTGNRPRLYIGGVAWVNGTGNGGYVAPQELNRTILSSVDSVGRDRFGGMMLWDGAFGHVTMDEETGLDIIGVAKASLLISGVTTTVKRAEGPAVLLPVVAAAVGFGLLS
ncbi:glycoside hydrolase superfamily [Coniochaeta sp. 2T2.1]|nr:glycoside hydrolase superfamily [Coniochaeta sp. 2T2.1]